jgi:predicted SnoaL-like aldol condensation-catalyzing enzyme
MTMNRRTAWRSTWDRNLSSNPDTPDGAAGFVESARKLIAQYPELGVEIKRVIAEDALVLVFS